MKKIIFAIILIYLAAVLENSFLNYFLIGQKGLDLILITFLILLFSQNWSFNKMLILGAWTGLILDIFRYPAFGTGIITILVLTWIYHFSYRWVIKSKKTINLSLWFFAYNILFYLLLSPISYSLAGLFQQPFGVPLGSLGGLGIQLLYNGIIASFVFFSVQQVRKNFLR